MRVTMLATLAGVVLLGACNNGIALPGIPATADASRGALLYDKWWTINGGAEPLTDHPDYPPAGVKTGSTTWRCKECHGWDYLGVAGAYATGSHFTGIAGVLAAQADPPQTVFDAIKGGATHDFSAVLSDDDIWDLAAFILTGLLDMTTFINPDKTVQGDVGNGGILYGGTAQCTTCHGPDGYLIDLGSGVPDKAIDNPWEILHKIRWGHPGSVPTMPSGVADTLLTTQEQVDVLAFSQTLLPTGATASNGGLLYDKWWVINGAAEPVTDHPDYPAVGQKTLSTTWRCKECHGWDYQGAAGAYATGSHFTGIAGVLPARSDPPQDIFDAIKGGATHDFSAVLSDADIWDLVAFVKTGTLDMQAFINPDKTVQGDVGNGQILYGGVAQCFVCHGPDGYLIDLGSGVPDKAIDNPWEILHKIRWGHPGSAMPSGVDDTGLTTQEQVDVLAFGQTLLPTGATASRGGLLYDKWWLINGAAEPVTDHPDYPGVGTQTLSTTWRCKECHGWDYLGVDGAYATGSHFTGIAGVLAAQGDPPQDIFDAIKGGATHDFSAVLSDTDIWDLVAFVKTGTIDMQPLIVGGVAQGAAGPGQTLFEGAALCAVCHGTDGKTIDFGGGKGVGDVAVGNPWEGLHKIRWGHPGSVPSMPSAVLGGFTLQQHVDILTHGQTLPTVP